MADKLEETSGQTSREETFTCCKECHEPLIMTFLWPQSEWYCVRCKRHGEFFGFGIENQKGDAVAKRWRVLSDAFKAAMEAGADRAEQIRLVRQIDADTVGEPTAPCEATHLPAYGFTSSSTNPNTTNPSKSGEGGADDTR